MGNPTLSTEYRECRSLLLPVGVRLITIAGCRWFSRTPGRERSLLYEIHAGSKPLRYGFVNNPLALSLLVIFNSAEFHFSV